jgi:chromate transporter
MGAPFIESTHGQLHFTAPLKGITAAVVGVIVNLAVFFAIHVWWPNGLEGGLDPIPIVISHAAFIALARFKAGVIPVIFAFGLAGLALRLLIV